MQIGTLPANVSLLLPLFLPNRWQGQNVVLQVRSLSFLLTVFVLIRSRRNNLKAPPPFFFFLFHINTQHDGAESAESAVLFWFFFFYRWWLRKITSKQREVLQINFSPASEEYGKLKCPELFQSGSGLRNRVFLCLSPQQIFCCSCFCCQSICAHGGAEKPIICFHLIRARNGVWYEDSAHPLWEATFPLLFFPCLLCQTFDLPSCQPSANWTRWSPSAPQKDPFTGTMFVPFLILQTF